MVETYRCDDAETIIVTLGSIAGLVRAVVDEQRAAGRKVGLLRIRYLRPLPKEAIAAALSGARAVAVLEKDVSFGAEGTVYTNVNSALMQAGCLLPTYDVIGGLGGADISESDIEGIFHQLGKVASGQDDALPRVSFIGVDFPGEDEKGGEER